jgi:hypothetical protein
MPDTIQQIGQSLFSFQSALKEGGIRFEEFIHQNYLTKWKSDSLYHAMAIRTTFVNAMQLQIPWPMMWNTYPPFNIRVMPTRPRTR